MSDFSALVDAVNRRRYKPGPGRPKGQKNGRYKLAITARLEVEQMIKIREVSEKSGTPVAELIRTYIEWGLENENN